MNLFEMEAKENLSAFKPLPYRLRPKTMDDILGQEKVVAYFKKMIKSNHLPSCIFFGPPGTGKTSISSILADSFSYPYYKLSAVTSGVGDIKKLVKEAKQNIELYKKPSILFLDEIHRFNKSQQDYLLPFVENGLIILIGATTENPYFSVNKALLSRLIVFEIKALRKEDLNRLIDKALNEDEIIKNLGVEIDSDARDFLLRFSNGDSRMLLNIIENAAVSSDYKDGKSIITKSNLEDILEKKYQNIGNREDEHYNTISAFIKSVRGSSPDAAIYYLAKLLEAGEDPMFIARRLCILASEDIGLANSNAINVASSSLNIVEKIGMPEARITLAEAAIYLALSPKSNSSYLAIDKAIDFVRNNPNNDVPNFLKDTHYESAKKLGYGINYKYPHNYENGYVDANYLPDGISEKFYEKVMRGEEKLLNERLNEIKKKS